jgi:hypothetical protein
MEAAMQGDSEERRVSSELARLLWAAIVGLVVGAFSASYLDVIRAIERGCTW